jgi:DNA-binding response OmpR family regulator
VEEDTMPKIIKGRRVLIIEDDALIAESMRMVLEDEEHIVETADTGEEGIAVTKIFKPEILLCDVGLPGMSGYDVARAIRAAPPVRNMYLIAMTGYGREQDRVLAKEAGFDLHLIKPVNTKQLIALIVGVSVGD